MSFLSPGPTHRTSAAMALLFDMDLRSRRRDRAERLGAELFLFERTFADCLDRLALVSRRFATALLVGCPDAGWPERLCEVADHVDVRDPGELFAMKAGGSVIVEDQWLPEAESYDLILAIGTLDTVNELPRALMAMRRSIRPDGLLLGAVIGGESLPTLRGAMRAADLITGQASPHIHPRIEASALAPLLANAGFRNPVVDIDRVTVSYRSIMDLVTDLRRMGATNILSERSHSPISRAAFDAAERFFKDAGDGERTLETFEILHFAAWAPAA